MEFNNEIYIRNLGYVIKKLIARGKEKNIKVSSLARNLGVPPITLWTWREQGIPSSKLYSILSLYKKLEGSPPSLPKAYVFGIIKSPHSLFIPKVVDEDLAYVIGYWLGDGTLSVLVDKRGKTNYRIEFYDNSKEQLLIILELMKQIFGLKKKILGKDKTQQCWYLRYNSKLLCFYFSNILKLPIGRRLKTIKIPDIVKKRHLFPSFVAGFFDAEGSVYYRPRAGYKLCISQKNNHFLKELRKSLNKFGFSFRIEGKNLIITNKLQIFKFIETIPFRHPAKLRSVELIRKGKATPKYMRLSKVKKSILKELKSPKTSKHIAELFRITRRTAYFQIRDLERMGKVKRVGKKGDYIVWIAD